MSDAERRSRGFLLARFTDYVALEQGLSPRTIEAYQRDLARFAEYAEVKGVAAPVDITTKLMREYVYHLKDLGLSPASIRRNVSAIRTYFRFLTGDGIVVRDPSERLETPKRWRSLPEVLTVEEVQRLLASPTLDDNLVFRDRALLELAYGAGLRVSEWITLGVRDLLLEEGLVRVFGKGSKERLVPIGRSAIGALAIYIREQRPKLEKGRGQGHPLPQRARQAAHRAWARGRSCADMSIAPASRSTCRRIRCGIRSRRICWRAAPTCAPCRRCSATPTSRPRRSTRTWTGSICGRCTGVIIHEGEPLQRGCFHSPIPAAMLLVIDNYDSFTYNLVQYLGELGAEVVVRRNDAITVDEIAEMAPSAMVLSPGPCAPAQAGITVEAIRALGHRIPTLGVCLGHQAIGEAYGGRVVRAARAVHGKTSRIAHDGLRAVCRAAHAARGWPLSLARRRARDAARRVAGRRDIGGRSDGDSRTSPRDAPRVGRPVSPGIRADTERQAAPPQLSRPRRRVRRVALAVVLVVPLLLPAQDVVVSGESQRASATIIRDAVAKPHVVRSGAGRLDLPRDSTITSTLIVLGRPTYLASRVQGDVVVIGSDLFLRPGAEITGRAVAIGGTVALTTLGHVAGGTESFRDETYDATPQPNGHSLAYRALATKDPIPFLQPAGIQGLMFPSYDRVDGLSMPVGALVTVGDRMVEVEASVTYRSRLGKFDPAAIVRVAPDRAVRFEGFLGIDTRTNDAWNYSDLVNSATTFFAGTDTRNYFRSKIGEGAFVRAHRAPRRSVRAVHRRPLREGESRSPRRAMSSA